MKQVAVAVVLLGLLVGGTYLLESLIGDSTMFNTSRHLLFGAIAAWGTKVVFRWRASTAYDATPWYGRWLVAVAGFALGAVLWEVYEFRAGTVRANLFVQDPYDDTIWDLEHGLMGACVGMLIPVRKEKESAGQGPRLDNRPPA